MYTVDQRDKVTEITDFPEPDTGAPLPVVFADDLSLFLAYILSEADPKWDGSYVTVVGKDSERERVAIVQFERPRAHMLGPPNDEAFDGHPLSKRGLRPYSVFEVTDSSWIRTLERMNQVHPNHSPKLFERDRHFIFTFHDTTFECVAESASSSVVGGSLQSAVQRIVEMWGDQ